jgi:hypothetical protein
MRSKCKNCNKKIKNSGLCFSCNLDEKLRYICDCGEVCEKFHKKCPKCTPKCSRCDANCDINPRNGDFYKNCVVCRTHNNNYNNERRKKRKLEGKCVTCGIVRENNVYLNCDDCRHHLQNIVKNSRMKRMK